MLHICCQVKRYLSILVLGNILTNRQAMTRISQHISTEHLLDLSLCLPLCITAILIGTSKQTIFTILLRTRQVINMGLQMNASIKFKPVQNSSPNTLLIHWLNHCLSFVKLLDILSKCLVDGIERQSTLLVLTLKNSAEQGSQEFQQKVVI